MDNIRLQERIKELAKATQRLKDACEQPETSFMRDSVIQRFEMCWELAWKMLKLRLEELGVEVLNPRDSYREALNKGLINDGNAWSELQKQRNLTSHTYNEALALEVYLHIKQFGLALFLQLAADSQHWESR